MLKRYGDKALEESTARADELAVAGDGNGAATWRRIHRRGRRAREHDHVRTGPLTGVFST
jgi:hypothetical protein